MATRTLLALTLAASIGALMALPNSAVSPASATSRVVSAAEAVTADGMPVLTRQKKYVKVKRKKKRLRTLPPNPCKKKRMC
jgi:hypothetical protein